MRSAIENAIYYSKFIPSYLQTPIVSFNYNSDLDSFNLIREEFKNCIDVKELFGEDMNMCIQILEELSNSFNHLLLGNISSIYIVNRKDFAIELKNRDYEYDEENIRVAILKIDSIKTEYKPSSWKKWMLGLGILSTIPVGYIAANHYNTVD